MADKVTAGRDRLGSIAPQFAALNDDVLFGQVWARAEQLAPKQRSMITISALIATGAFEQLTHHMALGKANGITQDEAVEVVTQLAFYCGWPKAWSAFAVLQQVYGDESA